MKETKLQRARRRRGSYRRGIRPTYPALQLFESRNIARPECGRNVSLPHPETHMSRILRGAFVFTRLPGTRNRSKYVPAIEDGKHATGQILKGA